MKCEVWSAECGVAERPAEGAGVWRLGSGVGPVGAQLVGGFLDRINRRDRIIPGEVLSAKRFQTFGRSRSVLPTMVCDDIRRYSMIFDDLR